MKTKLVLLFILCTTIISAQAPKLINYQGVARGLDGLPIVEENLGIQFEIVRSSPTGSVVFKETQTVKTNSLGLILTQIGQNGTLTTVNWANGPYYLRVSVDITGGTNYQSLGAQEIASVPYAMYAQNTPGSYSPLTGRLDIGGNSFTLSATPPTTITTSGVATMTNSATNNFQIGVPASSISVTSTLGAAGVSTTGVNAFNINIPSAITPTVKGAGAAVVSPTVGNNFTVTVPQTTLTQSGVVQVTSLGTNSFNVSVPKTTINQSGAAVVNEIGVNTFNVHVPQTDVVVTSTSGVAAFSNPGTNSFVINVPSPTIQATGLATSSSVGNLHTVNVPLLTYAQSTGILSSGSNGVNITPTVGLNGITLNVGPSSNAVSLAPISPWRQSVNTVTLGNAGDRVGIGATAPTENLQLQSAINTSASVISGNTNISSLMFGTNTSHGLGRLSYDNSNNTMSLWTNNVADRLYIDPSGNVAVGSNVAVTKFDVFGNLRIFANSTVDKLIFGPVNGINDGITGIYRNSGSLGFSVFKNGAPATSFGTANAYDAMYIEAGTGRVGLGINTPAENLEIRSTNSASMSLISSSGLSQLFLGTPSSHQQGRVSYDVINNTMSVSVNNTPRIFIDAAGNIGLSNTSPGTRLEVTGDISIPNGNKVVFGTQSSGSGIGEWIQNSGSGLQLNTASLPRVTVTNSGQVGIGTTVPSASLHINGTIRMGSETTPPNYPLNGGMIIRRVFNSSLVAGNAVASTPDVILERDGSNGGFRVNRVGTSSLLVCNCTAVTSANVTLGRTLNNLAAGVTQLYTNLENIVFIHCIFGDPYFNATQHTTEITLTRQHTDYFWVGTMNSTFNQ